MGIGKIVRRLAGPFEPAVAKAYRDFFLDIEAFADRLAGTFPAAEVVAEIGCGEGALMSALARRLPGVHLAGLDPSAAVGRLYDGRDGAATFYQDRAPFLDAYRSKADVVLICDVLHHCDDDARKVIWSDALQLVKPMGLIVFKDWLRDNTLAYWAGYASDRFITGDRIRYQSRDEWLVDIVSALAGKAQLVEEFSLQPWKCNHAFVLQASGQAPAARAEARETAA